MEYVATDAERKTIPYIKVTDASGQVREYRAPDTTDQMISSGSRHTMDCIDCHNTVGHPFAQTPEQAVDQAMAAQPAARAIPFARREGVRLIKESYVSPEAAERAIDEGLRGFYQARGSVDPKAVAQTVSAIQTAYRRNVFPEHEGHVRLLSHQPGAHHVGRLLPLPRRIARHQRREDDQRRLRAVSQTD